MSSFTDRLLATGQQSKAAFISSSGARVFTSKTWIDVHAEARGAAAVLRERGIGPGQVVAVLAGSPAEVAPIVQAIWLRGAAVTMLHQPTPRTDLVEWMAGTVRTIAMIQAGLVVVGAPFEAASAHLSAAGVSHVATAELVAGGGDPEAGDSCIRHGAEHDLALLQLTSGSTGIPKAIPITHESLYQNLRNTEPLLDTGRADTVMVSWLPLFHDMGMVGFLSSSMTLGYSLVKATPSDFMSAPRVWAEMLSDHAGTHTAAPNFAYDILARTLQRAEDGAYDLSSVRCMLNGAEPVSPATMHRVGAEGRRFGLPAGAGSPCYGMAEATLVVSCSAPGRGTVVDRIDPDALENSRRAVPDATPGNRALPTLGRIIDGIEAKIVGAQGKTLGVREVGDLHLRGVSITKNYITVDGIQPALDNAGWLDTGDRAYFTEDGQLVVCGRSKDLIIIGGRNIFPTDIERSLSTLPTARAGGIAAVPIQKDNGAEGFAVLLESADHSDSAARTALENAARERVIATIDARPLLVMVLPPGALPKTSSGKIRRLEAAKLVPELL
ncbi:AMP-binding protein [Nocardia huaxiensis]|uniref:AMP-binding protein n=1 Tax=Nocardia huaxiensis TaxID=2755382 RepID=A0A7D6ZDF0_9NOCA|nr:long-chain-fatty-acid--CoA ligase [Nocardia huaxiensis]QLY28279.1 AMP-binding protein [Nocardia huaxiensis]